MKMSIWHIDNKGNRTQLITDEAYHIGIERDGRTVKLYRSDYIDSCFTSYYISEGMMVVLEENNGA